MNPNKQKNVLNLSSEERYGYFIRKVADSQEVWLILEHGQHVLVGDNEESDAIPVWPEKEFAELMLTGEWKNYSVESMEVHAFIDWLNELDVEGLSIAGFPSIELQSVVVTANEMKNHLIYELEQYE